GASADAPRGGRQRCRDQEPRFWNPSRMAEAIMKLRKSSATTSRCFLNAIAPATVSTATSVITNVLRATALLLVAIDCRDSVSGSELHVTLGVRGARDLASRAWASPVPLPRHLH